MYNLPDIVPYTYIFACISNGYMLIYNCMLYTSSYYVTSSVSINRSVNHALKQLTLHRLNHCCNDMCYMFICTVGVLGA
jgi:hypothetical protein